MWLSNFWEMGIKPDNASASPCLSDCLAPPSVQHLDPKESKGNKDGMRGQMAGGILQAIFMDGLGHGETSRMGSEVGRGSTEGPSRHLPSFG